VLERHQTLYRICKTYEVDLKEVSSFNGISDPSRIQTGQRIFIPGAKKVLKVEIYIEDVVAEPEEKVKIIYKKFDFIWPIEGKVSDVFEEVEDRRHQGLISPLRSGHRLELRITEWLSILTIPLRDTEI